MTDPNPNGEPEDYLEPAAEPISADALVADNTRAELNAMADAAGVESADALPHKTAVAEAIVANTFVGKDGEVAEPEADGA